MEAEYIALSSSMRELIPTRELIQEVFSAVFLDICNPATIKCTAFEDNQGALILATSPRMTPRSKHIAVKYHFFRSHVDDGSIRVERVTTTDQIADIFTKGLPPEKFVYLRNKLMGW
jgi:hypothetical protein